MKNLNFFAILLGVALMTFFSCKKKDNDTPSNNNGSGYYMRFKADGVQTEYKTTAATMDMGDVPPNHSGYFIGYTESGSMKNNFAFRLYDVGEIQANKAYTEAIFTPVGVPAAYGIWYDADGKCLVSFKTTADPIEPFTATITEITNTTVKGTFSGKVREQNGTAIVEIAEGQFYLLRK